MTVDQSVGASIQGGGEPPTSLGQRRPTFLAVPSDDEDAAIIFWGNVVGGRLLDSPIVRPEVVADGLGVEPEGEAFAHGSAVPWRAMS